MIDQHSTFHDKIRQYLLSYDFVKCDRIPCNNHTLLSLKDKFIKEINLKIPKLLLCVLHRIVEQVNVYIYVFICSCTESCVSHSHHQIAFTTLLVLSFFLYFPPILFSERQYDKKISMTRWPAKSYERVLELTLR